MNLPLVLAIGLISSFSPSLGISGSPNARRFAANEWDWTQKDKWTLYYSDTGLPYPGVASAFVENPFWIPNHALNIDRDMYPEDGWMLVFREFGTPTDAPFLPGFALYNRFSGNLRFVFYNAHEEGCTNFKATFSWGSGEKPDAQNHVTANLIFSEPAKCFRKNFDPAHEELLIGFADKGNGWLYFDIPMVGFDPDISWKNPILNFKLTAVNIGQFDASGDGGLILKQIENGQAVPGGSSRGLSDFEALKAGYKWYRDTNTWVTTELTNPKNKPDLDVAYGHASSGAC